MVEEVWSFIETGPTGLQKTATKAATEASRLAQTLGAEGCGVLATPEGNAFADKLAPFGLRRLYAFEADAPTSWTPEAYADALSQLVSRRRPRMLVLAATALGSEVAARVSARLGIGLIANCVDFFREGESLVARKAVCGGKAHMTVVWAKRPPYLATVDPEALEAIEERGGQAPEILREIVSLGPLKAVPLRSWKTDPRQLDLTEASLVVGVGRPIITRVGELETLRLAAERCGAVFGVSRPVVDAGVLPKDRQIGASGNWLSADVYIACGVSGSSYHMMGLRQVRHLIAVNTDANAPIMKQVELGIVADLFEVLPALEKLVVDDQNRSSGE